MASSKFLSVLNYNLFIVKNLRAKIRLLYVEIKCQLDATGDFYCRSYCLLNMFRPPLCPSSGVVGILFPHINDDAESRSHQDYYNYTIKYTNEWIFYFHTQFYSGVLYILANVLKLLRSSLFESLLYLQLQ